MQNLNPKPPLYVDLDGTLIKTDILFESILLLVKQNIFYLALLPFWLCKGRANLKQQVANRVSVPVELLPANPQFLNYLNEQADAGRDLILISASNQKPVQGVSNRFGLFIDAIGSDGETNLRAENKLLRIQQLSPRQGFSYAGNSSDDLVIWEKADEVISVNCALELQEKLEKNKTTLLSFDRPAATGPKLWQALRAYQWLKNSLLFLPLLLSHQLDQSDLFSQAVLGFISFSLCASSVYLLNDMLDLNSDRQHATKCQRPFAAGDLSLVYGFLFSPLLLLMSFAIALLLPPDFMQILLAYWLITCAYSFFLKRVFLLDVLLLGGLYTLRIFAGSAAIAVTTTNWLFGFSMLLFLGLAILKRYIEFSNLEKSGKSHIEGRGYSTANINFLSIAGAVSSFAAVIVFIFYINAEATTRLYSAPGMLWFICPPLMYLLGRIWLLARQGKLDEDPVLFACRDHLSQFLVLCCGLPIWLAI